MIDHCGKIIHVSPGWDDFAISNNGSAACEIHVLFRPWTDFVTGPEVRLLFGRLVQLVREQQRPRTTTFRCDGPAVRRYMRMTIEPRERECVEIETEVLREEPREPVRLFDRPAVRSGEYLTMCSWCNCVRVGEEWCEIDDAIERLHLFLDPTLPQLTHTICGKCAETF